MKHLQTYESFAGDIARYNPKRMKNDHKFVDLHREILEDFEKYDKDLRKVSIITDNNKEVDFSEINIGKYYKLTYIFGKYHTTYNNIYTGNRRAGNRKVTISDVPFSITLKRNELERAFNTSIVSMRKTYVDDEKTINNPNYNLNSDRKGERHKYDVIEDRYRISYDMAIKLFKYFVKEYEIQYPDLKDSDYKNSMQINDIKRGIPHKIKWVSVKNKYGENFNISIFKGDDEKEEKKKVYNMTRDEYNDYYRSKMDKFTKPYEDKIGKEKKEWEVKIDSLLKKNGIDLSEYKSEWEQFGFRLVYYPTELRIEFKTTDKDIQKKVDKFTEEKLGEYKLNGKRVGKAYDFEKSGIYFVGLFYENE